MISLKCSALKGILLSTVWFQVVQTQTVYKANPAIISNDFSSTGKTYPMYFRYDNSNPFADGVPFCNYLEFNNVETVSYTSFSVTATFRLIGTPSASDTIFFISETSGLNQFSLSRVDETDAFAIQLGLTSTGTVSSFSFPQRLQQNVVYNLAIVYHFPDTSVPDGKMTFYLNAEDVGNWAPGSAESRVMGKIHIARSLGMTNCASMDLFDFQWDSVELSSQQVSARVLNPSQALGVSANEAAKEIVLVPADADNPPTPFVSTKTYPLIMDAYYWFRNTGSKSNDGNCQTIDFGRKTLDVTRGFTIIFAFSSSSHANYLVSLQNNSNVPLLSFVNVGSKVAMLLRDSQLISRRVLDFDFEPDVPALYTIVFNPYTSDQNGTFFLRQNAMQYIRIPAPFQLIGGTVEHSHIARSSHELTDCTNMKLWEFALMNNVLNDEVLDSAVMLTFLFSMQHFGGIHVEPRRIQGAISQGSPITDQRVLRIYPVNNATCSLISFGNQNLNFASQSYRLQTQLTFLRQFTGPEVIYEIWSNSLQFVSSLTRTGANLLVLRLGNNETSIQVSTDAYLRLEVSYGPRCENSYPCEIQADIWQQSNQMSRSSNSSTSGVRTRSTFDSSSSLVLGGPRNGLMNCLSADVYFFRLDGSNENGSNTEADGGGGDGPIAAALFNQYTSTFLSSSTLPKFMNGSYQFINEALKSTDASCLSMNFGTAFFAPNATGFMIGVIFEFTGQTISRANETVFSAIGSETILVLRRNGLNKNLELQVRQNGQIYMGISNVEINQNQVYELWISFPSEPNPLFSASLKTLSPSNSATVNMSLTFSGAAGIPVMGAVQFHEMLIGRSSFNWDSCFNGNIYIFVVLRGIEKDLDRLNSTVLNRDVGMQLPPNMNMLQVAQFYKTANGFGIPKISQTSVSLSTAKPTSVVGSTSTKNNGVTTTPIPPRIPLTARLFKDLPDSDFIDPINDKISIVLTVPNNTRTGDFFVSFTLVVGSSIQPVSLQPISETLNLFRYLLPSSKSLGVDVSGKSVQIVAQVVPRDKSKFLNNVTEAGAFLAFSSPPSGGKCVIVGDTSGVAWETDFELTCSNWTMSFSSNLTYRLIAYTVRENSQMAAIKENPFDVSIENVETNVDGIVSVNERRTVKLPAGRKETNYTIAIVAQIDASPIYRSKTKVFVGFLSVAPFSLSQSPLGNISQASLQLQDTLKMADTKKTLQIAQTWSSILTDASDGNEVKEIRNNLLQSLSLAVQNVSQVSISSLQQAASTMNELLSQNPAQLTADTQIAAASTLSNVAQAYLQQDVPVTMNQVQVLAQSITSVLKSNLLSRDDTPKNESSIEQKNNTEVNARLEANRIITQKFVDGVNVIAAVAASTLVINEPAVVLKTDAFTAVAQKTDVDTLSSVKKENLTVVQNLDQAIGAYDFSESNPSFASKPREKQVILTKFFLFPQDPFSGLSSDLSQNERQRSQVSSLSLADETGSTLSINNTKACINLNFAGNLIFKYIVTNSSLNISTIELAPDVSLLNVNTNESGISELTLAPKCQYWDFEKSRWSTNGCSYVVDLDNLDKTTCCCRHLTDFSVELGTPADILMIRPKLPPLNRVITIEDLLARIGVVQVLIVLVSVYFLGIAALIFWRHLNQGDWLKLKRLREEASPMPTTSPAKFVYIYKILLMEEHLVFSVFKDHSGLSSFSQLQRWSLVFAMLLLDLTVVTAFYASTVENGGSASVIQDFVTGIYVSFATFPFSIVLVYFFDRPLATLETPQGQKRAKILARIGYILCIIILGLSIYFLLAYAVSFPEDAIAPWMSSFLGSVFDTLCLSNPVKVVALTILTMFGYYKKGGKLIKDKQQLAEKQMFAEEIKLRSRKSSAVNQADVEQEKSSLPLKLQRRSSSVSNAYKVNQEPVNGSDKKKTDAISGKAESPTSEGSAASHHADSPAVHEKQEKPAVNAAGLRAARRRNSNLSPAAPHHPLAINQRRQSSAQNALGDRLIQSSLANRRPSNVVRRTPAVTPPPSIPEHKMAPMPREPVRAQPILEEVTNAKTIATMKTIESTSSDGSQDRDKNSTLKSRAEGDPSILIDVGDGMDSIFVKHTST